MDLRDYAAPESFKLFNRYWTVPAAVCLGVEIVLVYGSVLAAYQIRFRPLDFFPYIGSELNLRAAAFTIVVVSSLYFHGLYDLHENREGWHQVRLLSRAFGSAAATLWILYYLVPTLWFGRGFFALAILLAGVSVAASRWLLGVELRGGLFNERVVIVGSDETAKRLAREILERKHLGYQVVGFLSDDPELQGKSLFNPSVIGTTDHTCELAIQNHASKVVIAQDDNRGHLDVDSLLECQTCGISVERSSAYYEQLTGKILIASPRVRSWLAFSGGLNVPRTTLALKRLLDLAVSGCGLILLAPLVAVLAIAQKLSSSGPVHYHQERVGKGGKIFEMIKLRSMVDRAEDGTGACWAKEGDQRITRVGRLMRKTHLDELPQLWNVFVGNMSLVGPRPERPEFVSELTKQCLLYDWRGAVRPGITGWAQIKAPYAASVEDSEEKLMFDLYYIKNLSLFLDLSILASTLRTALLGKGAR